MAKRDNCTARDSFARAAKRCTTDEELSELCFTWLKLHCTDYGKDGRRASLLLNVVRDLLSLF